MFQITGVLQRGCGHTGFQVCLVLAALWFPARMLAQTRPGEPATPKSIVQALQANDNSRALSLARELTGAYPDDPRAWTLQGLALMNLEQARQSLEAFEHALQIDSGYVAALQGAAQLHFKGGSQDALPFLEKLLQLNPNDQTSHGMMAALAFRRKDCAAAVDHYGKCPQAMAGNVPALSQFGACLLRLDRPEEAISVFQQIAGVEPRDSKALYSLALAQYRAHRNQDAVRTLAPLTAAGPEKQRAAALNLSGAANEEDQKTPQAVAELQKAIALAPDIADNYLDLAAISLNHGAFKLGVDVLNAGIQAVPDSSALYLERGVIEVVMERYEEANADFRKAAELNPRDHYGSLALGMSLLQGNKVEESLEKVEQSLAKTPGDPDLNYLLAELLVRKGVQPGTPSFEKAKAAAQRAVRGKPDFALACDVLTELYLRSGDVALAEETARLALKANPQDQSAIYNLIVCLRKKGDRTELPQLVQRLTEITAGLRRQENTANRFRLVVAEESQPEKKPVPR